MSAGTKSALRCKSGPKINLNEDSLPPEYTPHILLNDKYDQYIEISNSTRESNGNPDKAREGQPSCTADTSLENAPICGVLPSTSAHESQTDLVQEPPTEPSPKLLDNSPIQKGSPFTRFLNKGVPAAKKIRENEATNSKSPTTQGDLIDSPLTPEPTGDTRLERLLAEAAEETSAKLQRTCFGVTSEISPAPVADPAIPETMSPQEVPAPKKAKQTRSRKELSSSSDSASESESESSSDEEMDQPAERALIHQKKKKKGSLPGKRAKPRHTLSGWMYHKYPILKFSATAPSDAARHPHKYRCRVCLVELSLKTKGPLEILKHYRTDAHLVREHRIRMETPGLPLYDRNGNELTGVSLKYAKDRAKREYPVAPKLGEYFLRIGQLEESGEQPTTLPNKELLSQLNLVRFGLVHGGHLKTVFALWHDLVRETKTTEPITQYVWRPHRVLVSCGFL